MLSLIIFIIMVIGLFKLTAFVFRVAGKLLGGILGIIGWLVMAGLAAAVFSTALFVIPIILIIGIVSLIAAASA